MAEFLTTHGVANGIDTIMRKAGEFVFLVSPYLKLSNNFYSRLKDLESKGVQVYYVYGKKQLNKAESDKLYALTNLRLHYCEDLHAKCYANEKQLIVTSMNLYEYSEKNNREMGISALKTSDLSIYQDGMEEIDSIIKASIIEKDFEKVATLLYNKPQEEKLSDLPLNPEAFYLHNFHVPVLFNLLKSKLLEVDIRQADDKIEIFEYPLKGMNVVIDGRIEFWYYAADHMKYEKIRDRISNRLNQMMPGIRVYWNDPSIHVYMEKDYVAVLTERGRDEKARKFLKVFETIANEIK